MRLLLRTAVLREYDLLQVSGDEAEHGTHRTENQYEAKPNVPTAVGV
jgi:hypothetical protein